MLDYCATVLEITEEKCTDGVDNDGNGFTDCADFSCSQGEVEARRACQESVPFDGKTAVEICQDGIDNDADGFTDCEDWDCSYNPEVKAAGVCGGRGICE